MIASPLRLHETRVPEQWVDYNGHMSESCYLLAFGDSSDAFFRYVGVDEGYRASGKSLYTVETHLRNLREAKQGELLAFTLRLVDVDAKRLHVFHEMHRDGELLATAEQMLLHVDTGAGRAATMPLWLHERLSAIRAAHAELPPPAKIGHAIGIPR